MDNISSDDIAKLKRRIGDRLRRLRKSAILDQSALAGHLGKAKQRISDLETGAIKGVPDRVLVQQWVECCTEGARTKKDGTKSPGMERTLADDMLRENMADLAAIERLMELPRSRGPASAAAAPTLVRVRAALDDVQEDVRSILAGVNSTHEFLMRRDGEGIDVAEIEQVVRVADDMLSTAHRASVYKWRRFLAMQGKAAMAELYWPQPDRLAGVEKSLSDIHGAVLAILMEAQPVAEPGKRRREILTYLEWLRPTVFHLVLDLGDFKVELDPGEPDGDPEGQ